MSHFWVLSLRELHHARCISGKCILSYDLQQYWSCILVAPKALGSCVHATFLQLLSMLFCWFSFQLRVEGGTLLRKLAESKGEKAPQRLQRIRSGDSSVLWNSLATAKLRCMFHLCFSAALGHPSPPLLSVLLLFQLLIWELLMNQKLAATASSLRFFPVLLQQCTVCLSVGPLRCKLLLSNRFLSASLSNFCSLFSDS